MLVGQNDIKCNTKEVAIGREFEAYSWYPNNGTPKFHGQPSIPQKDSRVLAS